MSTENLSVSANALISGNLVIGTSSYTPTTGTSLIISQNSTFDNSVNGTINGNVYPQLSFGAGTEHVFATML
jgi:hypothetical protein